MSMTPKALKRRRQRLGLSQVQFAKMIGIAPNSLARLERGERAIRPTLARLVELLTSQKER